jgi:hypothetical protein
MAAGTTGAMPPNPYHKPGYRLEFADEFDAPALDSAKWLAVYLPQWSSRERSQPNYRLGGGALTLEIGAAQLPWCPEWDGANRCSSLQTGVFAGPLGSPIGQHRFHAGCVVREEQPTQRTYTPQYGYVEIRARVALGPTNLVSLWMIGFEDRPERSGEIAVMEIKGRQVRPYRSTIAYGVHPWSDPKLADEFYADELPIDAAQLHIYAVEWMPQAIDVYVDNRKLRTIPQSPAYPMQLMLGLYDIPALAQADDPPSAAAHEFVVDYVRVYQPVGGYPGAAPPPAAGG